jgi:hypothetical protein
VSGRAPTELGGCFARVAVGEANVVVVFMTRRGRNILDAWRERDGTFAKLRRNAQRTAFAANRCALPWNEKI